MGLGRTQRKTHQFILLPTTSLKTLEVNYGFLDDIGVFELSPFYTIGLVTANTDVADDIDYIEFKCRFKYRDDHTNIGTSVDLRDFFSVSLVAGVPYTFDLEGRY